MTLADSSIEGAVFLEEQGRPMDSKQELLVSIHALLNRLDRQKSSDRTDRDRLLAIAITDAQKLAAFIVAWL
jgi:hypothetical protein